MFHRLFFFSFQKNAILLTVSPTTCQSIIEMLEKYVKTFNPCSYTKAYRFLLKKVSMENHDITYLSHLRLLRYIFFADKVEIKDITKQTCLFALAGPKSNQVRLFFK